MKRSTMWMLVGIVLGGVFGALLPNGGVYIGDWRWWAFLAVFIAYGEVRRAEGRNRRKEVIARAAMEAFCDFLRKASDIVIIAEAEDSGASDG